MSNKELDYDELGFKCGIEIHQQLDTDTKLFCGCDNTTVDKAADHTVTRQLRPVASELGDVDTAAKYEYLKEKDFVYNVYNNVSCLVELDEEPPHPVNPEALDTAMELAMLMDCDVPDEIHFMRKMVIDGSNTAGFQRTAIIGLNGELETSEGTVAIEDMELEEESAGIHTRKSGKGIFDLDRLGIPLIEIGTDASIQNPAHAKEVAEEIGMLLRSTMKVKRGLGTIRQDVNVSIADGARVEIKGFQELAMLDELVRNEVKRQNALVEIKEELQERGITDVAGDAEDVTHLFEDSENQIIHSILDADGVVLAFTLHGLEDVMNRHLSGDLTLGKELANYATSQGVKGLMHTDEDISKYDLDEEFAAVCDELDKQDGDVVAIIAAPETQARNAADVVLERADKLPHEIPEETRTAEMDYTTKYARPLPGRARMYPETDIPPIVVDADYVQEIAADLPETLDEREERYSEMVGEEYARQLIKSQHIQSFESAVDTYALDPDLVANVLTNVLGDLESRHGIEPDTFTEDQLDAVFQLLDNEEITKGQVADVLQEAAETGKSVDEIADAMESSGEDEIREVVQDVIAEKEDLIKEQGEHARGALMGLVMQQLDNPDGATVNKVLSEELQKAL